MFSSILEYLEYIAHFFQDVLVFIGWIIYCIYFIFLQFFNIVKFIFNFLTSFISNSFNSPISPNLSSFPTSSIAFLDNILYWNEVKILVSIMLLVLGGIAILKLFLKT